MDWVSDTFISVYILKKLWVGVNQIMLKCFFVPQIWTEWKVFTLKTQSLICWFFVAWQWKFADRKAMCWRKAKQGVPAANFICGLKMVLMSVFIILVFLSINYKVVLNLMDDKVLTGLPCYPFSHQEKWFWKTESELQNSFAHCERSWKSTCSC